MTENLNISPDNIILYGRSIGSGPSSFLAEKYPVAGVILHSGLMSAFRVVFNLRWTLPVDYFPNIDRMPNIECPVYIIHGKRDEIVPFYHAQELHKATKNKYPPYYVDGAGHNNVEKFASDYLPRIKQFIAHVDSYIIEKNRVRALEDGEDYDQRNGYVDDTESDDNFEENKVELPSSRGLQNQPQPATSSMAANQSSNPSTDAAQPLIDKNAQ